ncbi:uncharacterized protein LOC143273016 isoform X3 [Peromyscus maniculatus bairdii]|uniref:uncharacterized protein LOC143273016 isoform X3 n=1 Tax=Peromyscus maniculatus bairdii TaxID=230844 RepID=UPI003FD5D860
MPRLGAVRRLPPSAGRSDARLPAGHRRNPTGAEQCPCAAEKTARVSWADPVRNYTARWLSLCIMARASSARVEAQLIMAVGYIPRCSLGKAHNENDNDPNTKGPESPSHHSEEPTQSLLTSMMC